MKDNIVFGNKTYIMGILNVNDDSFVSSSRCCSLEDSLRKAEQMIAEGVDILDVGGESTRLGSIYVEEKEEIKRVIPVVKQLVKLGIPISVDTYKPNVAKQALENGVSIVNDVTGGRNPKMFDLIKEYGVKIFLMHNKISSNRLPHARPVFEESKDIVREVLIELENTASRALKYEVCKENIILDPGLGFQKHWKDSLLLIKNLYKIKSLGYPVLVGASNKGFIGKILSKKNPEERLYGTLACTAVSAMQEVDIIRVHEVQPNLDVVRMINGIYR